jgi:hypothetical protein
VTTSGFDSGFGSGHAHVDELLGALAEAEAADGDLMKALARLHTSGGGSLALVTTALVRVADLNRIGGLRSRYGTTTVVAFDPVNWPVPPTTGAVPGVRIVRVTQHRSFADAWNATFSSPATAHPTTTAAR